MKITLSFLVLLLCTVLNITAYAGSVPPIIPPTGDFKTNFLNFPQAWTVTKGKGVKIAVLAAELKTAEAQIPTVSRSAPAAEVRAFRTNHFAALSPLLDTFRVILLWETNEKEAPSLIKAIEHYRNKGCVVILPAYQGPMQAGHDYRARHHFIKRASQAGAVIVGAHGRAYQLGNLDFWKKITVDTYALHTGIDGDQAFNPEFMADEPLQTPSLVVAGAIALLRAQDPKLEPMHLKKFLRGKGRKVTWYRIQIEWSKGKPEQICRPFLSYESMTEFMERFKKYKPKPLDMFRGSCLDAGLLLGLEPLGNGEWSYQALKTEQAHRLMKMSTAQVGSGVTVALLDHMFDQEHPSLKGRLVHPGSVTNAPVFSSAGHGTWMAETLLKIAPAVNIMPVRIISDTQEGADYYIKGIQYAVKNGADIISLSHREVPSAQRAAFDAAIKKATQKGIVCVFIHYQGKCNDVVIPSPVEFAGYDERKDISYIVGTNFINKNSFPYTWGVSQTAPIAAGVIAMMKQLKPKLTPLQIKELLLSSVTNTPDGFPLLDAAKVVEAIKSDIR